MPSNAEAERKRAAAQNRKAQRVWVPREGGPIGSGYWFAAHIPASEHGEWNTYNNWYCRCWDCKLANSIKFADWYWNGNINA